MAIVKRLVKGSELTYQEMDGNLTELESVVLNSAKKNESNSFTLPQRTNFVNLGSTATIDFSLANNFEMTATASILSATITANCIGQSGVIIINSATTLTGFSASFVSPSGTLPTLTATTMLAYFIKSATVVMIGKVQ